ncbi:carboxylesterase family protein [Paenibacillus sp. E222]|uniref:carboxylesterase family protein n=1 Tax=Paenibacillus sp. E222 TaxID=2748863 RepID=UPI0015C58BB4|nr:carboxylesterase family protein [Paenibacillus sp. E222]
MVQNNIAQFGGDPYNVTVIGKFSGAILVNAPTVSPVAQSLFSKTVVISSVNIELPTNSDD